jgi:hypothetical protein
MHGAGACAVVLPDHRPIRGKVQPGAICIQALALQRRVPCDQPEYSRPDNCGMIARPDLSGCESKDRRSTHLPVRMKNHP